MNRSNIKQSALLSAGRSARSLMRTLLKGWEFGAGILGLMGLICILSHFHFEIDTPSFHFPKPCIDVSFLFSLK